MIDKNLKHIYQQVAVVALNTVILLVAVNLVLAVFFAIRDQSHIEPMTEGALSPAGHFYENGGAVDNGKRTPSNLHIFDYKSFEGVMSEQDIAKLLDEFFDLGQMGFEYQAHSQYGHRVFSGEYLNVDMRDNGLTTRRTINPRPTNDEWPTIRIFTFGGSTTFGKGVADADTWPSILSDILNKRVQQSNRPANIEVVNYGRVGFYPTQEVHQFMEVLRSGERPDVVIFLDGLNFGRDDDTPSLTTDYIRAIDAAQYGSPDRWSWLPMVRAANALRDRVLPAADESPVEAAEQRTPEHVVERFLQARMNAAAVAELYDVQPYFFLQPDAHYNYPAHLFGPGKLPITPASRAFKEQVYSAIPGDSGYIDLTGLFAEWGDRKAIVDTGHYSPNFSRFVAEKIAAEIDLTAIAPREGEVSQPTGVPRQR